MVIGPAGGFTINTKHHPGANVWVGGDTFMVNGVRVPYVRDSRFEAKHTSDLLGAATGTTITVSAMIAVVGADRGLTIREQPPGHTVLVVSHKKLNHRLAILPEVLSDDRIQTIYAAARRSTRWRR